LHVALRVWLDANQPTAGHGGHAHGLKAVLRLDEWSQQGVPPPVTINGQQVGQLPVRARIGVVLHSVLLAYAWVAACITDIITRLVPSAFGLLVLSCCIAMPCLCGSPPGFGPLA
jgi:hypothetical protein